MGAEDLNFKVLWIWLPKRLNPDWQGGFGQFANKIEIGATTTRIIQTEYSTKYLYVNFDLSSIYDLIIKFRV